ncbi:uncharacterized protein LOC113371470 [Ctenocephalides felis]|uniref:uncharacterized protein LOC113371470 n=1 Tax=Ctenocephalides felis TaxID=7515 RepID=UPI000E6E1BFD|nr:uncharacterized protein LOC113371470 [Ctenocephalides felis]
MATGGDAESLVPEALRMLSLTDLIALIKATTSDKNEGISSSELLATIPIFDGSSEQCIEAWFERVEAVRDAYEVPKKKMAVLIISKLSGRARQLYDSKAEYATYSYDELKRALIAFFKNGEDRMTRMKRFESRRWRKQEPFSAYFQEKMALGNRLGFIESDLLAYMIDGFDNPPLQAQAKMNQFKDLATLLGVMNELTAEERGFNMMPPKRVQPTVFPRVEPQGMYPPMRCFNCGGVGHMASRCIKPKNDGAACYKCGSKEHQQRFCKIVRNTAQVAPDSTTLLVNPIPAYKVKTKVFDVEFDSVIDSGSAISIIKRSCVPNGVPVEAWSAAAGFEGINHARLDVEGIAKLRLTFPEHGAEVPLTLHVVPENTMNAACLLGRDMIQHEDLEVNIGRGVYIVNKNPEVNEILAIDEIITDRVSLNISEENDYGVVATVEGLVRKEYLESEKPDEPETAFEMSIVLKPNASPFYVVPRRISFYERGQLGAIIQDLLDRGIIRESNSEFCSPIVIVRKKDGKIRLCVDYRELNKRVVRDPYPSPRIDDCLDSLKSKRYFTKLDLKDAFFHVVVAETSRKYTSFVCAQGQYEYNRMPFGYCNSPNVFIRYVSDIFRRFIVNCEVIVYMDDLLIATETIEENIEVLRRVLKVISRNKLELKLSKCSFVFKSIDYLGYHIDVNGIRPSDANIEAIVDIPIPKTFRQLRSFIGLASYFRKFIKDFSVKCKPLYDLCKNGESFVIDGDVVETINNIKNELVNKPVLAIYSPSAITELHTDGSAKGYGAVLCKSRLMGNGTQSATILVTDCNSLKLALQKKEINPKLLRWSLVLSNCDYELEHRAAARMQHVDALSRCHELLVIEENSFDRVLAIRQGQDPLIRRIRDGLEREQHQLYELRDGLVYRKFKERLLFLVPSLMVEEVSRLMHEQLGHAGVERTAMTLRKQYWFSNMNQIVNEVIHKCLKCIAFSSWKVADRGSCYTSDFFRTFLEERNVKIVHIAAGAPWANGQVERANRTIVPMLAKYTEHLSGWDAVLYKVEYALNNAVCKSTGETPSILLFGVTQRGEVKDEVRDYLLQNESYDKDEIRKQAAQTIERGQDYNKRYHDKRSKEAEKYKIGDMVMITNVDTTIGVNKKLLPKYKGPYLVKKVLDHDRYAIGDVEGFQVTQMPMETIIDPSRMRLWFRPEEDYGLEGSEGSELEEEQTDVSSEGVVSDNE